MTEKFTAKTIEEAKKLASKKFGVAESKIKFEIVEEGKRGFLGIGKSDAVVRATYIEEAPAAAKPIAPAPAKAEVKAAPAVSGTKEAKAEAVAESMRQSRLLLLSRRKRQSAKGPLL